VRLEASGALTLTCNRSEMGQGIRSSIPALMAMEMGADLARVEVFQAPGDPVYGNQNTDGSRSIRNQYDMLRGVAAVAREVLERAGAARLGVPVGQVRCEAHHVVHAASGRRVPFGELSADAARLPVPHPDEVTLRDDHPPEGWDLPLVDAQAWITGEAEYAADVRIEGMLTAVIVRPPVLGAHVVRFDDAKAREVDGVVEVVEMPRLSLPVSFAPLGGVAVVARDTWSAIQGAKALEVTWSESPHDGASWGEDLEAMLATLEREGNARRSSGDVSAALAAATDRVDATYVTPMLAHAPLEPPAAVAHAREGSCEVWACVQTPQRARSLVAGHLGLREADVEVHVTFLGAAFGRKSKPDFVVEAAHLSRALGKPVRVQWLREDAMRQGYFHAPSAQRLTAAFDAEGKPSAWRHRIASPSISSTFSDRHELSTRELGQGILDLPLDVPNVSVETHPVQERVRIGWMRSVYNINHAFSVQSFVDELASARGVPFPDFVKELMGPARHVTEAEVGASIANYGAALSEHPIDVVRYHRVIDRARQMSGFDGDPPPGRARGFAVHRSFLTYVAVVVEVSRAPRGGPKLERAWIACDPGRIVNRDRVRAQLEGGFVFGASLALHGHLDVQGGRVTAGNFDAYRVLRMHEAPRSIDIAILTGDEPPGGVGEPGVPPVAPAITNAWFALTGERVRTLPFHPREARSGRR
jgi:isoquinoline 1-oxidoreductase beta subunit